MILKVNIVITEMEKVLSNSSIFSVVMVFLVVFIYFDKNLIFLDAEKCFVLFRNFLFQ